LQKSTGDMIRGFKDKDNLGCFEEFFLYGVCSEKKESKKAVYSESNNKKPEPENSGSFTFNA